MKQIIIKGFAVLLLGLCFVFQAVDVQALPIVVRLDISDPDISVDENFSVEVRVDGVVDSDLLERFGFFVDRLDFTYSGNPFVFGAISPGIYGDDILLATLEFIAPSTDGSYSLGIKTASIGDTLSSDGLITQNNRYDMTTSVNLDVSSSPSAVPEPATLLLLGSGVVGIAAYSRKFRVRG
ncbi:MAG TPA: PEP-CTERM sorting domain-containing protein [Nitrospirae bacterium]|nr:PEP-CTERM sorting domain-containing protein [Nitrospirota bacterium]HDZ03148.1 PEP-CTERM sorting domain-containing protein [Nitrospirota bacterium]